MFSTVSQWTLTQECAPAPIPRPEGWTFPGVIVSLVPDDGIRGLRADSFKTYYLAFAGSNFIEGAALSPDGKWLAVPYGYIQTAASADVRYIVQELRIISTTPIPQISARVSLQASFQYPNISLIQWQDDTTLRFPQGSFLQGQTIQTVQPFTGEINPTDFGALSGDHITDLSPDFTRAFSPDYDSWGMFNLQSGAVLARFDQDAFYWSPDSTQFLTLSNQGDQRWLQLYDREGQLIANIADLTPDRLLWNVHWSPDGTKFVYSAYDPYKNENTLYIADTQMQTITDTCVLLINRHDGKRESGVIWSPDGTQLALLTSAAFDNPNALQIMEIESGQRYSMGVYIGGLIGWGAN